MSKPNTFALVGGIDEVSQPLAIKPGRVLSCVNYEALEDGYARVEGYERFDGRTLPSETPFWLLSFDNGTIPIVSGYTVTGALSGATGLVMIDPEVTAGDWTTTPAVGRLGLRAIAGTFQNGEALLVGGISHASADGTLTSGMSASGDEYEDDVARAARAYGRSLITAVPGSGPVRGVWEFNGTVYAFRDNAGGTAGAIYKSSPAGWVAVGSLGHMLAFTSGGATEILEGQAITGATSAATAIVRRVVLRSGTWGAGDAAGYFILSNITGVFVAENLNVGASLNLATIAAAPVANALPAGGRYFFLTHNFYGASGTRRIYGVNGVGPSFEFDGTYFVPILTGATVETPERIAKFRNQLFLSYPNGLVQGSEVGEPTGWDSLGGAWEVGIGSDVADFIQHTDSLLILGKHGIFSLTGYDSTDFALSQITDESGAKPFTGQRIGAGIYLDNRGLRSITTSQEFGNFSMGAITESVKKTLGRRKRSGVKPIASVLVRTKSHYRMFYDDGSGLSFYVGRKAPEPMYFELGKNLTCVSSNESEDEDTLDDERMFFGDDQGFVYQLDSGPSYDGDAILAFVRLAYSHMGAPNVLKRVNKVSMEVTAPAPMTLRFIVDYDYASREQFDSSQRDVDAVGTGGLWDVSNYDEFFWSGPDENVLEAEIEGQGFNASMTMFSESDSVPPHILRGATFYYLERGVRR